MRVKGQIVPERYDKAMEAKRFFLRFLDAEIPRIAVENPTPLKLVGLPPYTQAIQPYEYGHPYSKRTCLWLKNLSKLEPTDVVEPICSWVSGCKMKTDGSKRNSEVPPFRDPKIRSKSFPGIARAMAEQWGGLAK